MFVDWMQLFAELWSLFSTRSMWFLCRHTLPDAEAYTNPIDRTVAQLLFHRPLESCTRPMNDELRQSPSLHIPGMLPYPSLLCHFPLLFMNYRTRSNLKSFQQKTFDFSLYARWCLVVPTLSKNIHGCVSEGEPESFGEMDLQTS